MKINILFNSKQVIMVKIRMIIFMLFLAITVKAEHIERYAAQSWGTLIEDNDLEKIGDYDTPMNIVVDFDKRVLKLYDHPKTGEFTAFEIDEEIDKKSPLVRTFSIHQLNNESLNEIHTFSIIDNIVNPEKATILLYIDNNFNKKYAIVYECDKIIE